MDRRTGFGTAGTYLAEEKTPARRRLLKTLKTRPLHHSWAVGNVSCLDLVTTLENKHDCTNVVVVIVYEFRGESENVKDFPMIRWAIQRTLPYDKADYAKDFAHDKAGNAKDMASDAKDMAYDKAGNAKEMAYEKARHLQMT
ncbi:hypothetical protein F2Q70_00001014 [Brassica cretica]|uniref:Uncharacterized protein n=3 Tax=Brassica cretica TaxID=69181 RepID=A0A8S9IZZ3_BRACR|nr:hypothetical protein F2Q70_00001014 [Brassica cretica]